jgi:NADH-quinone oxidoreductase subunit H
VVVLALVLLLLAPTARLLTPVARAVASELSDRRAMRWLLGVAPPDRGLASRARGVAWRAISALSVVVALGVLPFAAKVGLGGLHLGVLLVLAALARMQLAAGRTRGDWLAAARDTAAMAVAMGAAILVAGTMRIDALVAAQGGAPWEWLVFRQPAAFIAFPAFCLTAARAYRSGSEGSVSAPSDVVSRCALFMASAVAAAVFLGGWNLPGVAGDPLAAAPGWRLLGALVFVAKALGLLVLMVRVGLSASPGRASLATGVVAFVVAATTLLWVPPPALEMTAGWVLCAVGVVALGRVLFGALRAPRWVMPAQLGSVRAASSAPE